MNRLTLLCCLVAAGVCCADLAAQDNAPDQYVGIVTAARVHVRAKPGITAYPCAMLSPPAKVTVVGSRAGWFEILPPPGTFSAIRKDAVRLDPTGTVGTIIGDDVWVRAGGKLHSNDFYAVQRFIKKGRKVKILGQAGDFYKIVPPPGAYFYISARYVKRSPEEAPAPKPLTTPVVKVPLVKPVKPVEPTKWPAALKPATRPATQPKAVKSPHTKDEIRAAVLKFRTVDRELINEFRKPLRDRLYEPFLPKYEVLRKLKSGYLSPYIDARIKFIKACITQQQDVREADALIAATDARLKAHRERQASVKPIVVTSPARYAAAGVLTPSSLFPGTLASPKRYSIYDRRSETITAYVQCTTGAVDLAVHSGKEVGVYGSRHLESGVGLIVEATGIKVIDATARGLPTAKPMIIEKSPVPVPRPMPIEIKEPAPDARRPQRFKPAPGPPEPVDLEPIEVMPASPRRDSGQAKPRPVLPSEEKPTPPSTGSGQAEPTPKDLPLIVPKKKPSRPLLEPVPEPSVEKAKPRPVLPGEPVPASKSKPKPTTMPAPLNPLPPTGLPMIDAKKGPGTVEEDEFE